LGGRTGSGIAKRASSTRLPSIALNGASAGDELKDDDDNGNNEQQVDKAATDMEGYKAQQPEHQKNYSEGIKHGDNPSSHPSEAGLH
jgi:hypothetical protein